MEHCLKIGRHLSAESLEAFIRPEDEVLQTVRLEGQYADKIRFLCVVSHELSGEYYLLGADVVQEPPVPDDVCREEERVWGRPTLGFVFKMLWDTEIKLDGDGGFSVLQNVPGGETKHFIFKPLSVQSLWTVIQTLHMIKERLEPSGGENLQHCGGPSYYVVSSSQSCINEWHAMSDLLVKRPPSPGGGCASPEDGMSRKEFAESLIKSKLRFIMKAVDLDTITSVVIRRKLEEEIGRSLELYKSFIDEETLLILGQMDSASKILDYLFLGSEWNASNLDELRQNKITHILNVTREIDNFFPAVFRYKNIRVYDEEGTDLLRHFDATYKFIREAKEKGGCILVHCKMGISRSASVVISYAMKEYGMDLEQALILTKECRSVVNPNKSFLKQLEVYEGMLGAIRHRLTYCGKISRSKSESSLIQTCSSGGSGAGTQDSSKATEVQTRKPKRCHSSRVAETHCGSVDVKALSVAYDQLLVSAEKSELSNAKSLDRPRSWSPSESAKPSEESEDCKCFDVLSHNCAEAMKMDEVRSPGDVFKEDEVKTTKETQRWPRIQMQTLPSPVNSVRGEYNPNCDCNVEVELNVPDVPVKIHDSTPDQQTDIIVQNLSNVPIRMRSVVANKVGWRTPKRSFSHPVDNRQPSEEEASDCTSTSSLSSAVSCSSTRNCPSFATIINPSLFRRRSAAGDFTFSKPKSAAPHRKNQGCQNDPAFSSSSSSSSLPAISCTQSSFPPSCDNRKESSDRKSAQPGHQDFLSVKTLANMYDFRIGTSTTPVHKPCFARLEENQLVRKAEVDRPSENEEKRGDEALASPVAEGV